MGTITKGEIILSSVNDAYTVSLTPSTVMVNADFDGSHPNLEHARTVVTVKQGDKPVLFKVTDCRTSSGVTLSNSPVDIISYQTEIAITSIPSSELNGYVELDIMTQDNAGYVTTVRFTYTVVRETSMLDWILDWEGSKTKVGDSYIMTPKLFVGKKEDVVEYNGSQPQWVRNALTGVYIGPDLLSDQETHSVGLYGYHNSKQIFRLNEEGGMIGGWYIEHNGIKTIDGKLRILSEGSIKAVDNGTTIWGINKNGEATFARGNVLFNADGNAYFSGEITTSSGEIGGWEIGKHQIHKGQIYIGSTDRAIGILTGREISTTDPGASEARLNLKASIKTGGLMMYHTSSADYGIACYLPTADSSATEGSKVFSLGSSNFIAGWNFNENAFYRGTLKNENNKFTNESGSITIGTEGLRGYKWRIESNGSASFSGGEVVFNVASGKLFGWYINPSRLTTDHIALVSDETYGGLYMSPSSIAETAESSLASVIANHGGIGIYADPVDAGLYSHSVSGELCFALCTNGFNKIGPWHFNHQYIYNGTAMTTGFTNSGDITIGIGGIRGPKWRFEADGSGAVAGDNIKWSADGTVTFASNVSLAWSNISDALGDRLTKIDANGIYTGTISADNVTAGTIVGSSIVQSLTNPKWQLNADGSGTLSDGNISWDTKGNCQFTGQITAASGDIGGWQIIESGIKSIAGNLQLLSTGTIGAYSGNNALWEIKENGEAQFAQGNVTFNADGSASFTGAVNAESGSIGGWEISNGYLHNGGIVLSSADHIIGIVANRFATSGNADTHEIYGYDFDLSVKQGGLMMYHNSSTDYGLACYLPRAANQLVGDKIFSIGTENRIAGWSMTKDALYTGVAKNISGEFTELPGHITIGTNGIRGNKWRIESDGSGSLGNGNITWDSNGNTSFTGTLNAASGNIGGWEISNGYMSNGGVFLSSSERIIGIAANGFVQGFDADTHVLTGYNFDLSVKRGGVMMYHNSSTDYGLVCYLPRTAQNQLIGPKLFSIGTENRIAGWSLTENAIYTGETKNISGEFTERQGYITIGTNGIRGNKWRLESDGSGALAGGKIAWNPDGSGHLANHNIEWEEDGDLAIKGDLTIRGLSYENTRDFTPAKGGFVNISVYEGWHGYLPVLPKDKIVHYRLYRCAPSFFAGGAQIHADNPLIKFHMLYDQQCPYAVECDEWLYSTNLIQSIFIKGTFFLELIGIGNEDYTEWIINNTGVGDNLYIYDYKLVES